MQRLVPRRASNIKKIPNQIFKHGSLNRKIQSAKVAAEMYVFINTFSYIYLKLEEGNIERKYRRSSKQTDPYVAIHVQTKKSWQNRSAHDTEIPGNLHGRIKQVIPVAGK